MLIYTCIGTHTNHSNKLKWPSPITSLPAHCMCGLIWWSANTEESMAIHDTKISLLRPDVFKQHKTQTQTLHLCTVFSLQLNSLYMYVCQCHHSYGWPSLFDFSDSFFGMPICRKKCPTCSVSLRSTQRSGLLIHVFWLAPALMYSFTYLIKGLT